jgi:hypothetical protein
MVPLALPARSLDWGSTRDTLYLKITSVFPATLHHATTRVSVFMRQDRTQTRESSLTCIPALLSSSDPEVFFPHSLPAPTQNVLVWGGRLARDPTPDGTLTVTSPTGHTPTPPARAASCCSPPRVSRPASCRQPDRHPRPSSERGMSRRRHTRATTANKPSKPNADSTTNTSPSETSRHRS